MEFFVIFLGYLLGSIPFGFIFGKILGKDVLKIGWKKTSGSNVFKNVGPLAGILTAVGDIGKGFLAVKLAQFYNLPLSLQAFSGVASVFGHNWSIFIKFAGGRGIATFLGVILAFYPQILIFAILPTIFFVLFFDSSLATIFLLFYLIFLSNIFGQWESIGIFTTLSLFPIFLKRLSPISEISLKRKELIKDRLLFDDDIPHQMRILKFLRKR